MNVADLFARGAAALAGGFFDALDEPGVGDEVLNPRGSADIVDLAVSPPAPAYHRAGTQALRLPHAVCYTDS